MKLPYNEVKNDVERNDNQHQEQGEHKGSLNAVNGLPKGIIRLLSIENTVYMINKNIQSPKPHNYQL